MDRWSFVLTCAYVFYREGKYINSSSHSTSWYRQHAWCLKSICMSLEWRPPCSKFMCVQVSKDMLSKFHKTLEQPQRRRAESLLLYLLIGRPLSPCKPAGPRSNFCCCCFCPTFPLFILKWNESYFVKLLKKAVTSANQVLISFLLKVSHQIPVYIWQG